MYVITYDMSSKGLQGLDLNRRAYMADSLRSSKTSFAAKSPLSAAGDRA